MNKVLAFFNRFTRAELWSILDYFGQPVRSKARKADLVEQVSSLIGGRPKEWLYRLTERDLMILDDITLGGPDNWTELKIPEYPSVLELLGLIDVDDSAGNRTFVHLDPALFTPVSGSVREVIRDKAQDGSFYVERLAIGILNLYGVIPVKEFVELLFDMFEGQEEGSPVRDMASALTESSIIGMQRAFYNENLYLVSPYAYDFEDIIEGRGGFPEIKDFRAYGIQDAAFAGFNTPYCTVGYGSPEYKAVRSLLENLGYSEEEVLLEIHDIWINSQYSMDEECAEDMFRSINDRIDELDSFDMYKQGIDTIAAYANSIPKWLLSGHTSDEVNMMKLSIRIDETPLDDEPGMETKAPDEVAGPLNEFYRYGLGIRHVAPDDPCPCGSGLSYRRCHGKTLN